MLPIYLTDQSELLAGNLENSAKRGSAIGYDLLFVGRPLPIPQGSINIFDRTHVVGKFSREPAAPINFTTNASVVVSTTSSLNTAITMSTGGSPVLQTLKARSSSVGYDLLFVGRPLPTPQGSVIQLDRYELAGKYARDFSTTNFPTLAILANGTLNQVNNLPVGNATLTITTVAGLFQSGLEGSVLLELIASGAITGEFLGTANLVITTNGVLTPGTPNRRQANVIYCPRCDTIEVVDKFSPRCRCNMSGRRLRGYSTWRN